MNEKSSTGDKKINLELLRMSRFIIVPSSYDLQDIESWDNDDVELTYDRLLRYLTAGDLQEDRDLADAVSRKLLQASCETIFLMIAQAEILIESRDQVQARRCLARAEAALRLARVSKQIDEKKIDFLDKRFLNVVADLELLGQNSASIA